MKKTGLISIPAYILEREELDLDEKLVLGALVGFNKFIGPFNGNTIWLYSYFYFNRIMDIDRLIDIVNNLSSYGLIKVNALGENEDGVKTYSFVTSEKLVLDSFRG